MKLHVLCDCDDNKVCTGNFDGQPMWHFKSHYQPIVNGKVSDISPSHELVELELNGRVIPKSEWTDWMKEEAYKQNSD